MQAHVERAGDLLANTTRPLSEIAFE